MAGQSRRGVVTRRALCGALGLVAVLPSRPRAAEAASAWSVGEHARVRLIDAGPLPTDARRRLAGLQIELDPGYLTYWRSPGEAGVPPSLDTAGSANLKGATLLFPAPRRYSEDGVEAFGYKDAVLFPLLVDATEAGKPLDLHAALSFGVCERQCLPGRAAVRLPLSGDGGSPEAALVREALARVPATAAVGESGALAIMAVGGVAGDDELTVLARTTETDMPSLFAEAGDPWFVQAGPGLWMNNGTLRYVLKVLAKPPEPAALPLRLTLVGTERAIEVAVTLDAPPPKP